MKGQVRTLKEHVIYMAAIKKEKYNTSVLLVEVMYYIKCEKQVFHVASLPYFCVFCIFMCAHNYYNTVVVVM